MRLSDLDGRRVGIWGFGREGRAALDALTRRARPAAVRVYAPEPVEDERDHVEFVTGDDPAAALAGLDVIVRSPGVSVYEPALDELRNSGATITTGTSLWFGELPDDVTVVGVTGTKGKSTTASLLAHLARAGGRDTRLAGNVGVPLLTLLDEDPADLYVIELSSYQTADLEGAPDLGVVLNVHREHLDWHRTEERYVEDKLRLVANDRPTTPVINATQELLATRFADRREARWFGDERGVHLAGDAFTAPDGRTLASREDLPLLGVHNAVNACAALEALAALGALGDFRPEHLRDFEPLPHRLEPVAERDDVLWVNDSISTTPESAIAAVTAFPGRPATLIAGGHDRGQDHAALARTLAAHQPAVAVVALPDTGTRLVEALEELDPPADLPIHRAQDLEEAVAAAAHLTPHGGVVLLSPAAASYNAYESFERRGEHFRALVNAL